MKLKFDVTAQEFKIIKNILEPALPANCTVWVFGSRAKNQAKFNSDLDLALDCKNKVALKTLLLLEEAFEESPLPYTVDIADMRRVELYFKDIIDKQKVLFPIQNNMPTLRFPEFSGEWPHKPVKELAEVKTGSRDTRNRILDGKYPFYVRSDTIERINSFAFDGEAILTSGDGVGVGKNIHYVNGKFDYHQRVYAIHKFKDDLFGPFFFQFFKENFLRRVMRLSAKNSVDSVRMSMITDMLVPAPPLPEQQKIAAFLSSVDRKIEQLGKKKALLEHYKKGVMQQMFSRELRFKDAQGKAFPEWVEKRLGDIVKIFDGTHQTPKYVKTGVRFYSVEHVTADQFKTTKLISEELFEKENKRVSVEKGDILMTRIGSIGVTKYVDWDVRASFYVSLALIKPTVDIIGGFLAQCIMDEFFQQELWKRTIHVAFPKKINLGEIGNCLVWVPQKEEQQKIADFLSAIDRKINLVTTKLTHAQTFKKGLMQQMFI